MNINENFLESGFNEVNDPYKFFVAQFSISIIVKQNKNNINNVIWQINTWNNSFKKVCEIDSFRLKILLIKNAIRQ